MKPVIFHREAEEELESCCDYYESCRPGLGRDFRTEIESKIWLIRGDPLRWTLFRDSEARKCRLKRFPYNIIYHDISDQIWIIAIAHQKRKPGYWANRQSEN